MKACSKCGEQKKPSDFYTNPRFKSFVCRACKKAYQTQYYAKNRERVILQRIRREDKLEGRNAAVGGRKEIRFKRRPKD